MKPARKKFLKGAVALYMLLWGLTATWGMRDVDRAFDRDFSTAYPDLLSPDPFVGSMSNQIPVIRVEEVNLRDPYGFMNQSNSSGTLPKYWRCRSKGVPIAPFLILDEAGAQWAPLAGVGGRRLVLWCFGWSQPMWIQPFWDS